MRSHLRVSVPVVFALGLATGLPVTAQEKQWDAIEGIFGRGAMEEMRAKAEFGENWRAIAEQRARRARAAVTRRALLRVNGDILVEVEVIPPAPPPPGSPEDDEGPDDGNETQFAPRARRFRFPERSFDQVLFGRMPAARARRAILDAMLADKVAADARKAGMTPAQEARLRLAGRGDVKRLLDRVEGERREFDRVKTDFDPVKIDTDPGMALLRGLEPLRQSFDKGPFHEGSLYAKTLAKVRREDRP